MIQVGNKYNEKNDQMDISKASTWNGIFASLFLYMILFLSEREISKCEKVPFADQMQISK